MYHDASGAYLDENASELRKNEIRRQRLLISLAGGVAMSVAHSWLNDHKSLTGIIDFGPSGSSDECNLTPLELKNAISNLAKRKHDDGTPYLVCDIKLTTVYLSKSWDQNPPWTLAALEKRLSLAANLVDCEPKRAFLREAEQHRSRLSAKAGVRLAEAN